MRQAKGRGARSEARIWAPPQPGGAPFWFWGNNSSATHILGGLGGVDALSIEEETHGTRLQRLAGAESREDLRGGGRARGLARENTAGTRKIGLKERTARGGRGRVAQEVARGGSGAGRTFSNLVVCLTLKCTSELSCQRGTRRFSFRFQKDDAGFLIARVF